MLLLCWCNLQMAVLLAAVLGWLVAHVVFAGILHGLHEDCSAGLHELCWAPCCFQGWVAYGLETDTMIP
jgi:hypothetical protein